MSSDSKIFDSIRVKSRRREPRQPDIPVCDWEGCDRPAPYKAPKANRANGEFHHFCLEHVRHYNQTFNYFADLDSDKIDDILKRAAQTGERPTWGTSSNPQGKGNPRPRQKAGPDFTRRRFSDPHNLFARVARNQGRNPIKERERRYIEADKRALETLGLDGSPNKDQIKAAYKTLVKKHHPDANGGDRGSEDRLRAIIAAYTHLKQKGFV